MLNLVWCGFFLTAAFFSLLQFFWLGNQQIFSQLMNGLFSSAETAFQISIALTGILALWLGLMKIAEQSGMLGLITRLLTPLFQRIMPEVPADHPAIGAMVMNISANALGLDNAATPLGIKAMQSLQTLNPHPEQASNAQILFLVINTSAVTLFPISIFTYRSQLGAANPTDVFIPILIATYCSTLAGFLTVASVQRLKLRDPVILAYLGGFTGLVLLLVAYFAGLPTEAMQQQSALLSNLVLFAVIIIFIAMALYRRVNAYDAFVEGAKEGFSTAVGIIPYLVAMLAGISVFRTSGALDVLLSGFRSLASCLHLDTRFVDALPTAFMKPFSGSGARAMMVDTMHQFGADSLAGRLASIVQGSTETTFYVLAVYFGVVGIRRVRHALACGLLADLAGIIAAIGVTYWFFGQT